MVVLAMRYPPANWSGRLDNCAVALLCRLGRRAEDLADPLPRHALGPRDGDSINDLAFPSRSGDRRPFQ